MMRSHTQSFAYFFQRLIVVFLFIAFAFLLGLIPRFVIPVIAVPFALQQSAVFLAGSVLGLLGFLSMLLFFILVALGVPLLVGGSGGIEVFLSPSLGFFIGSVFATLLIGALVERRWKSISFFTFLVVNAYGLILFYACGIIGVVITTSMSFENALKSLRGSMVRDVFIIVIVSCIALWFKRHYPLIAPRTKHKRSQRTKTSVLHMRIPTDLKSQFKYK